MDSFGWNNRIRSIMKSPATLPSKISGQFVWRGGGGSFDSPRAKIGGLDRGDNLLCVCVCPCIHLACVCVSVLGRNYSNFLSGYISFFIAHTQLLMLLSVFTSYINAFSKWLAFDRTCISSCQQIWQIVNKFIITIIIINLFQVD